MNYLYSKDFWIKKNVEYYGGSIIKRLVILMLVFVAKNKGIA